MSSEVTESQSSMKVHEPTAMCSGQRHEAGDKEAGARRAAPCRPHHVLRRCQEHSRAVFIQGRQGGKHVSALAVFSEETSVILRD